MSNVRTILKIFGAVLMISVLSSFTVLAADDSSKSDDHSSEKDALATDESTSSSQDQSKEKRSREEIFSGNQQDRPNGLVDDLMSMAEDEESQDDSKRSKKDQSDDMNADAAYKEDAEDKRATRAEEEHTDMMAQGPDNWYNPLPVPLPVSSSALQYMNNAQALQSLPSQDYASRLYDQEDVYRRKRQLLARPLPLRRRRSLRNSLGEMIPQRGLRMPRRSMRLKRQVDLYSLLGNDAFYDEQPQVSPHNYDGWEGRMSKRHVPGHFSSYPETPSPEFRYPFTFLHRDGGIMSDVDENKDENEQGLAFEDIDNLMMLHPNARFVEEPDVSIFPYRTRDEENEAFQKWLARYTIPNTFKVTRRSAPFYPLDYRYMPGYKKRNVFSHGNRMNHRFAGDIDETDPEMGTWGHVVQVPEAYASPEDVARLYGLASLMAEGDDENKAKRVV